MERTSAGLLWSAAAFYTFPLYLFATVGLDSFIHEYVKERLSNKLQGTLSSVPRFAFILTRLADLVLKDQKLNRGILMCLLKPSVS